MDRWKFLRWRKTLGYTQAQAAQELGVNRGTIRHWEAGITRIPQFVALACQELTRRWKQRPKFGPVTLVYADSPMWQPLDGPRRIPHLQCEPYPNNEAAIRRACRLRGRSAFVSPFVIEENGDIVWNSAEILRECEQGEQEGGQELEVHDGAGHQTD
jgi:DNA-binding XRE family transcriptional regulator